MKCWLTLQSCSTYRDNYTIPIIPLFPIVKFVIILKNRWTLYLISIGLIKENIASQRSRGMERSYRDLGRSGLASAVDYDDYGVGYDLPVRGASGAGAYLDREHVPLRDSYLSSSSSSSYRSPRGFDREIMESLVQQQALQQQLSLRESQLALTSSFLQQRQHQPYFNKRRMDIGGPSPRGGDSRDDFKRPRMMDNRSRPRNRSSGRDSYAGSRPRGGVGSRGSSGSRRYQSSSRGHGSSYSDRSKNTKDINKPEKPTADDDNRLRCRLCSVDFKDYEEKKKHLSASEHKEKTKAAREAGRSHKWYCYVCDTALDVPLHKHQSMTIHKKRMVQVKKGCGWCKVLTFKNFTDMLAHRSTEEHMKHQEERYGKREIYEKFTKTTDSKPRRERIKVEMPPELAKFDSKVAVGVAVVLPASGWFCKVCNKFYNNETSAKTTHCMTELHFDNYKKYMYQKLKAKAEAERDAKEQAEKEERKKKEEEEKAAKAVNGGDGDDAAATDASATDAPGEQGAEEAEESQDEDAVMEEYVVIEDEEGGQGEGEEEAEEEGGVGDWAEEVAREEEEEDYTEEGVEGEEGAAAAAEESVDQDGGEEQAEAVEEEPMVTEEVMEGEEGGEEGQAEEEVEKKATRASVSSSPGGRGRGRGAGGNRARRGRRIAK